MNLPDHIEQIIKDFPTKSEPLLASDSYVRLIFKYLQNANSFLEIGYRKGLFCEICKAMDIKSVHVDISDKLLRATPTKKNRCLVSNSLDFLNNCTEQFDLIFQDGSKSFNVRIEEYAVIKNRNILSKNGVILIDDLHYPECMRAFDSAIKCGWYLGETIKVSNRKKYKFGVMKAGNNL